MTKKEQKKLLLKHKGLPSLLHDHILTFQYTVNINVSKDHDFEDSDKRLEEINKKIMDCIKC